MLTYRQLCERLCHDATNGREGVTFDSPIYQEITEGRDPGPHYSSCVDLPVWVIRELWIASGRELPSWLRHEHGGSFNMFWSAPWRAPRPFEIPKLGDVWVIWEGEAPTKKRTHALICKELSGEFTLTSWDYGQSFVDPAKWRRGMIEGIEKDRQLRAGDPAWETTDGRHLGWVLTLDAALGMPADTPIGGGVSPSPPTPIGAPGGDSGGGGLALAALAALGYLIVKR
ncbi:MAG: hypothetical protein KIT41_14240 [Pyrinomonadaceae bacterium]|nr:hypothetical protein [Pyrinomonadaceae bacterium]